MSGPAKSRPQTAPKARQLFYRGVMLRKPATQSRFSAKEIRKAVELAVAKHADVLARSE